MVQKPKPNPKAKATRKQKHTDKAQSERFIEAAREIGIEDTISFDGVFEKVARPPTKAIFGRS